jgi:hypothetical protein
MAQPFNYNIASPMAAFEGSFNFAQAQEQKQRAEQAAREKQLRDQQMAQQRQAALQSIADNRSPENIARNVLLFPELKEQITASESILNEAERTNANQLRAEVIGLFRGGNIDAARARLSAQADGYRNTPGKEKQAAASEALLKTFDIDPDSVILPMTIQLAQSDEKLYKNLYGGDESLSATGKEYQDRVRIQGKEKADAWLELQGEKLFAVPEGGELVAGSSILGKGPITGRAAPPTVTFKPLPATGGQTDKPSGNFR